MNKIQEFIDKNNNPLLADSLSGYQIWDDGEVTTGVVGVCLATVLEGDWYKKVDKGAFPYSTSRNGYAIMDKESAFEIHEMIMKGDV